MYLAKILTKRLADSNVQRADETSSGMSGDLSQMPVAELLQALDLSQKTGTLVLSLSEGPARLLMKSGKLIEASYCDKAGKEAVIDIIKGSEKSRGSQAAARGGMTPEYPNVWESTMITK